MLALTEIAAEVIHGLATHPGMPAGTGLRIAPQSVDIDDGSGPMFAMSLSQGPAPDDMILEARDGDTLVYLEPAAVPLLADKVLDARFDEQGEVAFLLNPRPARTD
jgi:Fe-S cluster assembly iron-binding protein IscA